MRSLLTLACIVLSMQQSLAQVIQPGTNELRVGLLGFYDQRFLSASFNELPTVPNCCQSFSDAQQPGYTIGALLEAPLSVGISPTLRVMYTQFGGEFTSDEEKYAFDGGLNSAIATFKHSIDAKVHAIVLEPGMRLSTDGGFTVGLGVQIASIVDATFTQRETISSPSTITYRDGSRERNVVTGDLPNLHQFQVGLNLGAGYDFHFDNVPELVLGPEVNFTYNLSNIIDGVDWRTHTLRAGLVAKWIINLNGTVGR